MNTIPDTYPIPFVQDFNNNIAGNSIFSKLDLTKAYFHIPIHPEDIDKTTITTPLGAFRYKRLNFGLRNAPASWSRFIGQVLSELNFIFFYLDDILIFSHNLQEHLQHLNIVFKRLSTYGLLLNIQKCVFGVEQLDFLGHQVSSKGVQPQQSKTECIRQYPAPSNQKQLRNFIGLISYYHKFIPNCAAILAPLNALVILGKASCRPVTLEGETLAAFNNAKNSLINKTILVHPRQSAEISIATDSSATTIAGVLQQLEDDVWKPLAFCSRKLTPTEQDYSIFSRELLAIYFAVKKFRYYVEYKPFHIYTDHKSICSAIKSSSINYLPREFRQASRIYFNIYYGC